MMFLPMYVIYDHPRDFPDHFVVRLWDMDKPTLDRWNVKTLDEARAIVQDLHPGAVCLTRSPEDDPVILETWL